MPGDLTERVARVLDERAACLFLSPHLDDAVLSCAALLGVLAERCPVTVVTVFTATGPEPHTRAARSFLRQCSASTADQLYRDRRREDAAVLDSLGIEHVHLGLADALYRRRDVRWAPARHLGRLVPEAVHRYPTYRFDIARSRVSRGDRALVADLDGQVADQLRRTGAQLLFAPLGVGRHVDHLVTRTLGERHRDLVVHYADFPYTLTDVPDAAYLARHALTPTSWDRGLERKAALVSGYRTQVEALFPGGRVPVVPETYYTPTAARTAARTGGRT